MTVDRTVTALGVCKPRAVAATAGMRPAVVLVALQSSSARHAACVGNPRAGLHRRVRTQRRFVWHPLTMGLPRASRPAGHAAPWPGRTGRLCLAGRGKPKRVSAGST